MKIVLALSVIILLGSCGKYERPFITFKSPEKRLTQQTWRCIKAVDSSGNEFEVFDHMTFEINNGDSTFMKISNHGPWTYDFNNPNNENDTIVGNWTWAYALEGNFNKQMILYRPQNVPGKNLRITVLSNKELVLQDQTLDNTTYHYAPL